MHWRKRFMRSLPNELTLAHIQNVAIQIAQAGWAPRRLLLAELERILWDDPKPRYYRVWPGIEGEGE